MPVTPTHAHTHTHFYPPLLYPDKQAMHSCITNLYIVFLSGVNVSVLLRALLLCEMIMTTCTNLHLLCTARPFTDKSDHPRQYAPRSCHIWVTLFSPSRRGGRRGGQKSTIPLFQHSRSACLSAYTTTCTPPRAQTFMSCLRPCDLTCTIDQFITAERGWCVCEKDDGCDLEGHTWRLAA